MGRRQQGELCVGRVPAKSATTRVPKPLTPLNAELPPVKIIPDSLHPEKKDRTVKGQFVKGAANKGRPGGNPNFGKIHYPGEGRPRKSIDTRGHLRRRMSLDPDDPCLSVPWTVGDRIAKKALEELERLDGMDAIRGMEIINRDAYGTQVVIEQGETLAGRNAREESEALLAEAEALRRQLAGT